MTLRAGYGLSTDPDAERATRAACEAALQTLDGESADLAVLFVTPDRAPAAVEVAEAAHDVLAPGALLGCTGQGVVGGAREIEEPPAVSAWVAHLPGTTVETFRVEAHQTPEGWAFTGLPADIPAEATALMLGDPFTFPAETLLERLNEGRPGVEVIGGMASGGARPGDHLLFCDKEVVNGGAVGALIRGRIKVRALVSQGCRPVGSPTVVTKADRNVIIELGGRPPFDRLRETFATASPEERALMQEGLQVGLVIDEYKDEFAPGDFLIRNVIGRDPESGAIAVGDFVEVGNTIQFHVRDARSADEELRKMLALVDVKPAGALLFTCNGRGSRLFGEPDHDAHVVQQHLGGVPLAGFFCAGELGPVRGRNFLHGFTASVALFCEG